MEDSPKLCSACNAEIQKGSKFCKECGKPVEDTPEQKKNTSTPKVFCSQCNAELTPEDLFCKECGKKIETITNCPKCKTEIKPGNRFCEECGTNVYEYKPISKPDVPINAHESKPSKKKDDTIDELKETGIGIMQDVEKTGKGLMKDFGSFLDKSSKSGSKKTIKPKKKNQNFLVCEKCGGYYELHTGESPEDFSDECECGGHLEHKNQHP
jgi:hypothetical protein